ncbi:MAG: DUF2905 domain-containing protein [Dethiobacteria bacterium]|nr:DUF2905 domain-containing protein [Bacillota bacterium]
MGKLLLIGGAILAAVGLIALLVSRLGLGRLPGDIFIQRENVTFYFPLATLLIVSIILTIIINLFRR